MNFFGYAVRGFFVCKHLKSLIRTDKVTIRKMALSPRESGEYIVANAKLLKVHESGIQKLANEVVKALESEELKIENFSQSEHHPKPEDKIAANWIFLVDTLNFCFWTSGNDMKWRIKGNTGYFALCAGINRALKEGIDVTNPEYYSNITVQELENIFRSDDGLKRMPLLEERVKCLHDVGRKLIEKYNGNFENCIKNCKKSAVKLLHLIVDDFECFRDEALFAGKRVSLYKRAQILVGDIWACFRGRHLGEFTDIGKITMFSDYRVPQVLVHFGALEYSEDALHTLKQDKILQNGDTLEVEIRGASIYIVEELKKIVLEKIASMPNIPSDTVNSILIDHFLWDYRRRFANELEHIPFHKVLSIYY